MKELTKRERKEMRFVKYHHTKQKWFAFIAFAIAIIILIYSLVYFIVNIDIIMSIIFFVVLIITALFAIFVWQMILHEGT